MNATSTPQAQARASGRARRVALAWLAAGVQGLGGPACAGVLSDGSWGRVPQSFSGVFTIPESLGRRAGPNLFHSFERFSLQSGESATFTTLSANLANVIARVSGPEATFINGTLRLSAAGGSAPNLYFINPQGISFGPQGRVSVPAALHLSTAAELRFADGQAFAGGRGPDSRLSVAAPEAFGFLGRAGAAPITLQPQARLNAFADGRDIDLVAGDLRLDQASVYTASGRLRLVAVGAEAAAVPVDAGAVPPTAQLGGGISLQGSSVSTAEGQVALHGGTVELADGASVSADPDFPTARGVEILARNAVRIADSFVSSLMVPAAPRGPSIRVESLGSIELSGSSGGIQTLTLSSAAAGDIVVRGASVTLRGQTGIDSFTNDVGNAGRITVTSSGPLQVLQGAGILSQSTPSFFSTAAANRIGGAESIDIRAGSLTVDAAGGQGAAISSESNFVAGPAGQVSVVVDGLIRLRGGGKISTSASANPNYPPLATQSAGTLTVSADALLIERAAGDSFSSGIFSDALGFTSLSPGPGGRAGQIMVTARDITVLGGPAGISTDSSGPGAPGSVSVTADRVLLDGMGMGRAYISSSASGSGGGGAVSISASDGVTLARGGTIEARTLGPAPGGQVRLEARHLTVDGAGLELVTGVLGLAQGSGPAGDLSIAVTGLVQLVQGGVVAASASGAGRAGAIDIQTHDLLVDARGDALTGVRSRALPDSGGLVGRISVVAAGDVILLGAPEAMTIRNDSTRPGLQGLAPQSLTVSAGRLLMDGASLLASSAGSAPGSAIRVSSAQGIDLRNDARILTSAVDGNGGPIDVEAARYLVLSDAQIASSVLGPTNGNGGDIRVAAPVLVLANGSIQANTAALRARGGDVRIDTLALVPRGNALVVGGSLDLPFRPGASGFSVIQAAAPDGVSGQVQVTSPALDLAGTLADLDIPPIDLGALALDICRIGAGSSLVRVGRGGLLPSLLDPARPGP